MRPIYSSRAEDFRRSRFLQAMVTLATARDTPASVIEAGERWASSMSLESRQEVRAGLEIHLARLWRYGLVLSGARDAAEDLVQATCVRALERADQFQAGTRLDHWLCAILRSIWLNEMRARRVRLGGGLVDATEALVVDGAQEVETNILSAEVLRAVGRLPEAQREAVLLVYAEGRSYSEAAELMGVPIGTVMSRLSAARLTIGKLK
jgi:RNA polymerase sigma-70 factor, ECF subfamily